VEIFIVALMFSPVFVDRHDLATAVVAYRRDPSQDNVGELQRQQRFTEQIIITVRTSLAVLLLANSWGLFVVGRRWKWWKQPFNQRYAANPR
jgi:hypothetical protein